MRLALLALLASCSKNQAPPPPPPPPQLTVTVDALPGGHGAAPLDPNAPSLVAASQLVTAIVPDWTSTSAELRLWERDGAKWKLVMGPWPGVVGTSGTAWGVGLHGTGVPAGRSGPIKKEGDGKSPAGVFGFRQSYGYATSAKSKLPYQSVDANWECVDDPKSTQYTKILDKRNAKVDWKSSEDMRRGDELYEWVVDVAHNPGATPGGGSCIFLHVWRGPSSATVGCTAMDASMLASLIEQLDPSAAFVLLPKAEYDALAAGWGLPR